MNPTADVLKHVIERLSADLPGVWVADHLPPVAQMDDHLPAVVVDLLPGTERLAWGGLGGPQFDGVNLDIDVFARSRSAAAPVADQVRALLHSLPADEDSPVLSVDAPGFSTRPDYNPHVRRVGGDVTVMARSARADSH